MAWTCFGGRHASRGRRSVPISGRAVACVLALHVHVCKNGKSGYYSPVKAITAQQR